ncbi:MAG: AI-2E family transporter [Eubacteriales bacterium]|uniref:AI-2E family transporter n=1 Tax=Fenollaria sp. TaxID=1965292 RepID=UPI002A74B6B9|nr:AI-2E family transporter [Fenollaria sp.]MDD7339054.1 AI-2E family transporter [Eubacteriales bacterium]MDY3106467.1 AI-2E family transporter [Fenollaria sp.]
MNILLTDIIDRNIVNLFLQGGALNGILLGLKIIILALGIYYLVNIGNKHLQDSEKLIFSKIVIIKFILTVLAVLFFIYIYKSFLMVRTLTLSILIAAMLAYFLNPLVKSVKNKFKISDTLAIFAVFLVVILIFLILGFTVFPKTVSDVKNLIMKFPEYYKQTLESINEFLGQYEVFKNINLDNNFIANNLSKIYSKQKANAANLIVSSAKNVMSFIFSLVLTPIFTFYFLKDKDDIREKLKKMIPKQKNDRLMKLFSKMHQDMTKYISGKIKMAIFVGFATFIMLLVLGVEFSFVIGIITCVADIVPYVGPLMGLVPAFVFAFIESPIKALWIFVLYLFIQWIENNIVGPKILSEETGFHPIVVLFLLIVGGSLFGFLGMILAVPIALVIKTVYNEYVVNKNN